MELILALVLFAVMIGMWAALPAGEPAPAAKAEQTSWTVAGEPVNG